MLSDVTYAVTNAPLVISYLYTVISKLRRMNLAESLLPESLGFQNTGRSHISVVFRVEQRRPYCWISRFALCLILFIPPPPCLCARWNGILSVLQWQPTVSQGQAVGRGVGRGVMKTLVWQRVSWLGQEEWVLSWLNALFCEFLILLQSFWSQRKSSPPTQFLRPNVWRPHLLLSFPFSFRGPQTAC